MPRFGGEAMQKKYRIFLFDADETLFDYKKAERTALEAAFAKFCLPFTEQTRRDYREINNGFWKAFERSEVTKEELQRLRFSQLFEKYGVTCDPDAFNREYLNGLSRGTDLLDGAVSLCRYLFEQGKKLYLITNGISDVQKRRMAHSEIGDYFSGLFISEEIGYAKPHPGYFAAVWSALGNCPKEEILIIGDSLTSDIKGGENAGIDTCWMNPEGAVPDAAIVPTYDIRALEEIRQFV
jgi:2-haloacid dehalogenase